ncbi:MAG: HlyD family efflux transporter periplasmic adaptor subunit [Pseudomonadales bacterium]|nr:HlyD family efflux transporter periplasmic adaptor subunit [Pseudomonadales bacterium]
MSAELFRKEAIQELSARHLDARRLRTPIPVMFSGIMLALLVVVASLLIGSMTYTRKHLVSGQLDETSTVVLHATDFGYVSKLHVSEGDAVRKGQVLVLVSYRDDERNIRVIQERVEQFSQAIEESEVSYQNQITALLERNRRISLRQSITRENIALQSSKIEALSKQLEKTLKLHKEGFVSNVDWLALSNRFVSEKQQGLRLQEQLVELQQEARDIGLKQTLLEAEEKDTLLGFRLNLSRAKEELEKARRGPYQVLTANRDGYISRVEVVDGGSVIPGQPIIYINDRTQATTATLFVPPAATGHLKTGDTVPLELEAFPLEMFGHVSAVVDHIPAHTVHMGHLPMYPVRLRLTPSLA